MPNDDDPLSGIWDRFGDDEQRLFDDAIDNIGDWYRERGVSDREAEMLENRIADDQWVAFLYHEALWDFDISADIRAGGWQAFIDYMESNYGIDWDEVYDWESYRAAYDEAE